MAKTRSTTIFDIVLVPFPFSDLSSIKQRPCLILGIVEPDKLPTHYIVAMMTSQVDGIKFPYDLNLREWQKAELPKPTLVRLSKIVTLDSSLIRKKIGTLTTKDQESVIVEFRKMLKHVIR